MQAPRDTSLPLDTCMRVETPERVAFDFRLAGPWRRLWAYLLDLLVRSGVLLVAGLVIGLSGVALQGELSSLSGAVLLLLWFAIEWLYYVLFEWLGGGATPGKRALGLRVVGEGGYPVGLRAAALRNLLRAADLMPPLHPFGVPLPLPSYVAGLCVSAADKRFRRLGDLVAGTVVVAEEPAPLRAAAAVEPPPGPGELEALPARPLLSAEERRALDAFLRRWKRISPARRDEMSAAWAAVLARRFAVPAPASPSRFLQLVYARLAQGRTGGAR